VAKTPSESLLHDILDSIFRGTLKIGDRLLSFDRMGRHHHLSVV
jgi:hypothetical protein